jgi:hypothetical protein
MFCFLNGKFLNYARVIYVERQRLSLSLSLSLSLNKTQLTAKFKALNFVVTDILFCRFCIFVRFVQFH